MTQPKPSCPNCPSHLGSGNGGSQSGLWGLGNQIWEQVGCPHCPVQEQGGAEQELVILGVLGALGNWLMFVVGLGLFPLLWGLVGDGMRRVLPHRRGFGLSLLEVGEDADSDDEGGQGDGVAHGVHEVQAVKHLLEEKD